MYGVYDGHGGQYIAQFAYFVIIYRNSSENLLRILESQEEYKKDKVYNNYNNNNKYL